MNELKISQFFPMFRHSSLLSRKSCARVCLKTFARCIEIRLVLSQFSFHSVPLYVQRDFSRCIKFTVCVVLNPYLMTFPFYPHLMNGNDVDV